MIDERQTAACERSPEIESVAVVALGLVHSGLGADAHLPLGGDGGVEAKGEGRKVKGNERKGDCRGFAEGFHGGILLYSSRN